MPGLVNGYPTPLSLDTCAEVSCVDEGLLARIGHPVVSPSEDLVQGADGSPLVCPGTCQLRIHIGGLTFDEKCLVVRGLAQDILIGLPALRKQKIDILNSSDKVELRCNKGKRVQLPFCVANVQKIQKGCAATISLLRRNKRSTTGALHLDEDTYLPPYSEKLVSAITSRYKRYNGVKFSAVLYPAAVNTTGTRMAFGVACIRNGATHVAVANPTEFGVTMTRGQVIGQFNGHAAQRYSVRDPGDITKVPQCRKVNLIAKELIEELDLPREEFKDFPGDLNISEAKSNLTKAQLSKLMYVLQQYQHLFSAKDAVNTAVAPEIAEHTIDLEQDSKPASGAPYRTSPANRQIISEHIKTMLDSGVIRASRSPWAAPVVLVPKKDGKIRFAVDYRRLNDLTIKEIYALPRIDDTLDALGGANYFSTFDLTSGYWQIPMRPGDRDKTAFVTHEGQYEWMYMPFGLTNAPATFQRMMNNTFAGLTWQCCLVYLDDIIIFSKTFEDHLRDIVSVMQRVDQQHLMLKPSKCHVCCTEVEYLGHVISAQGMRANPKKLEVIRDWPEPRNATEVQSFLGLCGYYRKLIRNFARREAPLRRLTLKNAIFYVGPLERAAFQDLKDALLTDPVMALPDFSGTRPFSVSTDACDTGVGAVLAQHDETGAEHIVAFASKMFSSQQIKWHTQEQEGYAIVWALEQFRPYLLGKRFTIFSDHLSLQWMNKSTKGKISRWAMFLNEFNFELIYRKGSQNGAADAASRLNRPTGAEEYDDDVYTRQEMNDFSFLTKEGEGKTEGSLTARAVSIISCTPHLPAFKLHLIAQDMDLLTSLKNAQANHATLAEAIRLLGEGKADDAKMALLTKTGTERSLIYRLPVNEQVLMVDGLLCLCAEKQKRILVPPQAIDLKAKLLSLAHDHEMAGHFGRNRTNFRLASRYYWPNIRSDIKKYVRGCLECRVHKDTAPTRQSLTPTLPNAPNELIGIDLIGPLPNPDGTKYSYILVMTDYFTKWPEAVALPSKESDVVAEAIYNKWYLRYGLPQTIHTDQGNEFTNDLLKRLNSRSTVDHQFTTPYNPSSNGEVERFNRTLIESLSCYTEQSPSLWHRHLDGVLFAYRTSVHAATGYSPYYLTYGREARTPLDILESSSRDIYLDVDSYGTLITRELKQAHKLVQAKLLQTALATKERWSKAHPRASGSRFQTGDQVLMWIPPINKLTGQPDHSQKFRRSWRGPYIVVHQRFGEDSDVYLIRDPTSHREWSINVNKLTKYFPQTFLSKDAVRDLRGDGITAVGLLDGASVQDKVPSSSADLNPVRNVSVAGSALEGSQEAYAPVSARDGSPTTSTKPYSVVPQNLAEPRIRVTQQERRRLAAAQLVPPDTNYDRALVSHELDCIVSHGKDRRSFYYMVQWADASMLPAKIGRKDFDTTEVLEEYWTTKPVNVRPQEFKALPYNPLTQESSHDFNEIMTSDCADSQLTAVAPESPGTIRRRPGRPSKKLKVTFLEDSGI